jgi:hypothetical protein
VSSGPVGLDVREYVYGFFSYTLTANGIYTISARKNWLVTKVQLYAGAALAATLQLDAASPTPIPVAAGGCAILEPNGAFKGSVVVAGNTALVVVEYWYQTLAGTVGNANGIPVDVTVPP